MQVLKQYKWNSFRIYSQNLKLLRFYSDKKDGGCKKSCPCPCPDPCKPCKPETSSSQIPCQGKTIGDAKGDFIQENCQLIRKMCCGEEDPTFCGKYTNHQLYTPYSFYEINVLLKEKRNPQPNACIPIKPPLPPPKKK